MLRILPFILLAILGVQIVSCDPVEEPEVNIIPPQPKSDFDLDTARFYARFVWDKTKDTIALREPKDTTAMDSTFHFQVPLEWKSEPVIDTTDVDEDTDVEDLDTLDWTYGPSAVMYPYNYILYTRDPQAGISFQSANKNIFRISFSYTSYGDTLPFWDIEDYLTKPGILDGPITWGRLGNGNESDSIWNNDARNGVMISYTDRNGVTWESDNDPAIQPGGYFQIDSLYRNTYDNESYMIMIGRCQARLYNDLREYKMLRAGEFKMKILTDIPLSPQPE